MIIITISIVIFVIIIINVLIVLFYASGFLIIYGLKDNRLVANITVIETRIILLLVSTLLFTILIYLTLGGTLSNVIIRNHYELLTIRRIENDVKVYSEIQDYSNEYRFGGTVWKFLFNLRNK